VATKARQRAQAILLLKTIAGGKSFSGSVHNRQLIRICFGTKTQQGFHSSRATEKPLRLPDTRQYNMNLSTLWPCWRADNIFPVRTDPTGIDLINDVATNAS
jgi:hypothetical protein